MSVHTGTYHNDEVSRTAACRQKRTYRMYQYIYDLSIYNIPVDHPEEVLPDQGLAFCRGRESS